MANKKIAPIPRDQIKLEVNVLWIDHDSISFCPTYDKAYKEKED